MDKLDKLLCILGKYNCDLKRVEKSSEEFLKENFEEYIKDLKAALKQKIIHFVVSECVKCYPNR